MYRYLDEVIEVVAARAPGLQEQLERALAEGVPYLILEGKVAYGHGDRQRFRCELCLGVLTERLAQSTFKAPGTVSFLARRPLGDLADPIRLNSPAMEVRAASVVKTPPLGRFDQSEDGISDDPDLGYRRVTRNGLELRCLERTCGWPVFHLHHARPTARSPKRAARFER